MATETENTNLQIVIARYNEDLEWMKEEPFNQYPTILYNKGENENYYHASNITQTIPLTNVGRESHTFLHHIIENYDQLAEVTVFLPGSCELGDKFTKAKTQILECAKHKNTVITCYKYYPDGVHRELYDFHIEDHSTSNPNNKSANPETSLILADIRPFGLWHEIRFPNITSKYVCYNCIIGISKKHILQHPKSYYQVLIHELSKHSNLEVGHFYERSWFSVFHPVDDAVVL